LVFYHYQPMGTTNQYEILLPYYYHLLTDDQNPSHQF
jgi:hypothetical protein